MAPAEVGETPMRGIVSYVLTGILLGLALYLIVPAGSLRVAASPAVEQGAAAQSVNRARKGNRMMVPMSTVGKTRPLRKSPILLAGCEPAFSRMSASAQANISGRCLA
jgi:hypothetical protein